MRDALDQTTREKRVILGELERERERGKEEERRARMMEEQLSQSHITNSELEKVLPVYHHTFKLSLSYPHTITHTITSSHHHTLIPSHVDPS